MDSGNSSAKVALGGEAETLSILGIQDRNLKQVRKNFKARFSVKGNVLTISGNATEVKRAFAVFSELTRLNQQHGLITGEMIEQALGYARESMPPGRSPKGKGVAAQPIGRGAIFFPFSHKSILPRTTGQKRYLSALGCHDLVFSIGPAGTGKTYLAVAYGLDLLFREEVRRLVLVRPAVEAGEKLGYLPGDLSEKIQPYLSPLYDALYEMAGFEKVQALIEKGVIEVIPLAYMRGRTLNDSFIILDEAQNTTIEQMKMFLTRLGINSRVVINGDITQVDLPLNKPSGLRDVRRVLKGVKGISFSYLGAADVVRHALVKKIIKAYDSRQNSEL